MLHLPFADRTSYTDQESVRLICRAPCVGGVAVCFAIYYNSRRFYKDLPKQTAQTDNSNSMQYSHRVQQQTHSLQKVERNMSILHHTVDLHQYSIPLLDRVELTTYCPYLPIHFTTMTHTQQYIPRPLPHQTHPWLPRAPLVAQAP